MTRSTAALLLFALATLLWFTDRVIAGAIQCDTVNTCPFSTNLEAPR